MSNDKSLHIDVDKLTEVAESMDTLADAMLAGVTDEDDKETVFKKLLKNLEAKPE